MKSVKTKLLLIITSISLIPLIITNFYFYQNLSSTLRNNTIDSLEQSLINLGKKTNTYLQTFETYHYLITKDLSLISALDTKTEFPNLDYAHAFQAFRDATKTFFLQINYKNGIVSNPSNCYLYLPNESVFMDSSLTFYNDISSETIPFYQISEKNSFNKTWSFTRSLDYHSLFKGSTGYSKNSLSYLLPLYENQNTTPIVSINLQCSYFIETFQGLSKITGGNLLVYKKNDLIAFSDGINPQLSNKIFSAIDSSHTNNGNFSISDKGTDYLSVFTTLDTYDLSFVYLIPDNIYLGNIHQIMPNVILLCIILLALVIGFCFYISHMFYSPIKPLLVVMEDVQNNNLETRIHQQRTDEYQRIYTGFNSMMDEVNSLIARLITSTSLQKDSQIKLLQAQMNPHFIYNTLESIYSLAKIHKEEEIATIIESLSSFYRFSLSGGASEITLQQAISMTEDYLTIQNFRFDNRITYEINVSPMLNHMLVPKFVLQAIVENSICHGIEPLSHPGHLVINATLSDYVRIEIVDNGIGIKKECLSELQDSIATPFESQLQQQETENFALRNLNQQIKLNYGNLYGVEIQSFEFHGTKVFVTLPVPPFLSKHVIED